MGEGFQLMVSAQFEGALEEEGGQAVGGAARPLKDDTAGRADFDNWVRGRVMG